MSYQPKEWSSTTPITVSSLNHIESGISEAHEAISEVNEAITETNSKVEQIAGGQIPEEYVQEAVEEYVNNNSGGFATKTELNTLDSKLSSEIEELKNETYTIVDINSISFVNGTISNDTWMPIDNRIITEDFLPFEDYSNSVLSCDSGYKFSYAIYDADKKRLFSTDWQTDKITITSDVAIFVKFLLSRVGDTNISPSEKSHFHIHMKRINEIERDFNGLFEELDIDMVYALGTMDANGNFAEQPNIPRVVTMNYIPLNNLKQLGNNVNYTYSVVLFDKEYNSLGLANGYQPIYTYEELIAINSNACYFKFAMRYIDDSIKITSADINNVYLELYKLRYTTVNEEEFNPIPAIEKFGNPFCKTASHCGTIEYGYGRNSYEGFLASCKSKVWGIETDLQVTSDGVIVCLHDAYHGRLTTGSGVVSEMTFAEQYETVRLLDNVGGNVTDSRICKFEDYLRLCKIYGKVPLIELKPDTDVYEGRVLTINYDYEAIVNLIREYGLEKRCIVMGSATAKLEEIRKLSDDITCMATLYTYVTPEEFSEYGFARNKNAGIATFVQGGDLNLTLENVKDYHKNGYMVGCSTATPTDYAKEVVYRDYGIDYVIADAIEDILEL